MKKAVYNFLIKTGLDNDDINFICSSYPEFNSVEYKKVIENAKIVVDYGFPVEELDYLILVNPGFLLSNTDVLEQILIELGDNIAEKLKNNPLLI